MSQAFKICLEDLINLIEDELSILSLPTTAIFPHSLVAFIMAIYLDLAELKGNTEGEVPSYVVNSYSMTWVVVSGYRRSDEDNAVSCNWTNLNRFYCADKWCKTGRSGCTYKTGEGVLKIRVRCYLNNKL